MAEGCLFDITGAWKTRSNLETSAVVVVERKNNFSKYKGPTDRHIQTVGEFCNLRNSGNYFLSFVLPIFLAISSINLGFSSASTLSTMLEIAVSPDAVR